MRSFLAVVALVALSALAEEKPAAGPSAVTIPLSTYDELRKAGENASATVIDTMTLGGAFRDRTLSVTFSGRSVGTRAVLPILDEAADVTLSGCAGDALVLRGGKGAFEIVALASTFSVKCDVRLSGSDRLQMRVKPSVLAVRSVVSDGELVAGDEDGDGARMFTLVRQVVGANETLATTATGRYLITLLPDTTRFRYDIQVHNPNRGTSPLPLKLVSNEHLQQIDSSAPYEIKDGTYVFAMPPGDSSLTLTGELGGASFAPPVAASLQYAVIESHPLLRPSVQAAPKRVSTGETGVNTQYRGAVAFEIGPTERITWQVTRLEAMRAISYAVRSVSHTLFIPANGPILGESTLQIDNQGAPELMLPPKPEPTFVSLGGEPVLMTRNPKGELTVPLSAGIQQVTVQHRQNAKHWGLMVARLDVPRVPIPATNTYVRLNYPGQWMPLWQSFASQGTVWNPEVESLLAFAILALWIERLLAFLGLPFKRCVTIAVLLAFASLMIPVLMWAVILACIATSVYWIAINRAKWTPLRIALTVGLLVVLFLGWIASNVVNVAKKSSAGEYESAVTSTEAPNRQGDATLKLEARGSTDSYQGLPAKFELPSGVRHGSFSEQMLAADRPQTITIVLLSMTLVTWLAAALAALAAWLLWRERGTMRAHSIVSAVLP